MHTFLMVLAVLAAACIALFVLCVARAVIKRYLGASKCGGLWESLSLSTCTFAILATGSIGTIYLAGSACRLDVTQIQSIDEGSTAAAMGFNAGDIITHVNGRRVGSLYEVLVPLSLSKGMTLTVARGRQSLDFVIPAALLTAGPTPDTYGLHFPVLIKPLSPSEALRQWADVASFYIRSAAGLAGTTPHFLVGVRFVDTFTFTLATLSFLLPVAAPLLVLYRRWSGAMSTRVVEPEAPREKVYAGV